MNILFVDTETNGLPRDWRAPMTKVDNWPRVIQLAYCITDEFGIFESEAVSLIKPQDWSVPNEPFWIKNGFSQEKSLREGLPISEVLEDFVQALNKCDVVVAHNLSFDYNVIGAEMIRAGLRAESKKQKVCTMTVSTDLMKLPGRFKGTYKFPKLEELHRFLFEEDFDGAHDALVDVMACVRCFFELVNRGVILIGDGVKV